MTTALFLGLSGTPSAASPISGVVNTGVDAAGDIVAAGQQTHGWEIVGHSAAIAYTHRAYFDNTAAAGWVAIDANGGDGSSGAFTYRLTFDLLGYDVSTASISGRFAADNNARIVLNGIDTGFSSRGFNTFKNIDSAVDFTLNSGFSAGRNVLDVIVRNAAGGGDNPQALFVEIFSATADTVSLSGLDDPAGSAVPAPAALGLALLGVAVLAGRHRVR